jgi:excinuclease ABC subunit B
VILYAEEVTDSMRRVIDTTVARRGRQEEYNRQHGIVPRTVRRAVQSSLYDEQAEELVESMVQEDGAEYDVVETVRQLETEMYQAAEELEFERAAMLRDQIAKLKAEQGDH